MGAVSIQLDPVVIPAGFYGGLEPEYGRVLEHIICCRPNANYCGRYEPEAARDEAIDGTECPICLDIWNHGRCPYCGCTKDETCERCAR